MQLRLRATAPNFADLKGDRGPVPPRQPDTKEITGGKGSVYYRAHSYHTKVPPEGIAPLVEHYAEPGGVVLDPFCGSGMTGLACMLTGRKGVLSDLSPAAVHIATNYTRKLEPRSFSVAGDHLLRDMEDLEDELYRMACPGCGATARAEYFVWSDVHACPSCASEMLFWDCARDADGSVSRLISCSSCRSEWPKRQLRWVRTEPVSVSISCAACRGRFDQNLSPAQRDEILSRERAEIPWWYPRTSFGSKREMWRGQHRDQGVNTAADFYTVRNLWALAGLWSAINEQGDERITAALQFAFTSIVNRASRRYQWNAKRPTNVLSSTLYIASLSYEFNVFSLLRRKLRTIRSLYETTWGLSGDVGVAKAPAQALDHVPDASIDYVFTDPPFGSNIFYSDASFLWESWLGDETDQALETVVNRSVREEDGGKDVADYEKLMTGAFAEIKRVLRPNAWASIVFHNSDDEVWSALQRSLESAGFEIGGAVALDLSQPSFKGIKGRLDGERVASFDLVLHVQSAGASYVGSAAPRAASDRDAKRHISMALSDHLRAQPPPSKRSTPYMHSLAMRTLLLEDFDLTGWTYRRVEALCSEIFEWDGTGWGMGEEST